MKRYQICYVKNTPLIAWENTLEAAEAKAKKLRESGYQVSVWEHTKTRHQPTDI